MSTKLLLDQLQALNEQFNGVLEIAQRKELIERVGTVDWSSTGPAGTILMAIETIYVEAFQGSNQACSDPATDTMWSNEELAKFVETCLKLNSLAWTLVL